MKMSGRQTAAIDPCTPLSRHPLVRYRWETAAVSDRGAFQFVDDRPETASEQQKDLRRTGNLRHCPVVDRRTVFGTGWGTNDRPPARQPRRMRLPLWRSARLQHGGHVRWGGYGSGCRRMDLSAYGYAFGKCPCGIASPTAVTIGVRMRFLSTSSCLAPRSAVCLLPRHLNERRLLAGDARKRTGCFPPISSVPNCIHKYGVSPLPHPLAYVPFDAVGKSDARWRD